MFLFQNNKANCQVIFGANVTEAEKHAAEELSRYLSEISGSAVTTASENEAQCQEHRLIVGTPESCRLIKEKAPELWQDNIPEKDAFVIRTVGEDIIFSGCRNRATIYSVYHFLETYLNAGFFWDGDAIHHIDTGDVPEIDLYEESAFLYRFSRSGSDCNAGYTFTHWWNFDQWKNEIDFLMKNKVNMARIGLGFDAVQKRAYRKMGINAPDTQIDLDRIEAAKKVYDYCNMVGIDMVNYLPTVSVSDAFYDAHPEGDYYGSKWVTGDEFAQNADIPQPKPRTLFPDSPVYKELIHAFLNAWKETYGFIDKYFIIQTPCESKITADLETVLLSSLAAPSKAVREIVSDAKIVIDGWNFRFMYNDIWKNGVFKRLLTSAAENEVIVLDLWPSWPGSTPLYQMEDFKDVNVRPFIVAFLNEFGGDNRMQGCFDALITEAKRMLTDASASNASGLGNTAEVMYFNVNYYYLLYRAAWNPMNIQKDDFIKYAVKHRYGDDLFDATVPAFRLLVNAVYTGWHTSWGTGWQSKLFMRHAEKHNPENKPLIIANLEAYLDNALPVPAGGRYNKFLISDIYEGLRQYLAEKFNNNHVILYKAVYDKNKALFYRAAGNMLFITDEVLKLVSVNKRWYIESEVKKLAGHLCNVGYGSSAEAVRDYIRDVGTTFGKTEPRLLDYSRKDYFELDKYYYKPRTEAYIDFVTKNFNNIVPDSDIDCTELENTYQAIVDNWIKNGYPIGEDEKETAPIWETLEEIYREVRNI